MARSGDLYDVLGVAKDASPQDIKKAFRVRARECHPDVAGGDPEKAEAFKRLREAYEVLSDPAERARYDRRGERRTNPFYGSMWNRGPAAAGPQPTSTAGTRAAGNDLDLEDIFNDFSGVGDFGFTGQTRGQPGGRFKGGAAGGASARPGARPGRSGFTGATGGSGASGGAAGGGFPSGGGARSRPEPGDFPGWNEGNVRTGAARPNGSGATGFGTGTSGASTGGSARRGPQPGRDIPVSVDVPAHVARDGGTVTVTYQRLRRADDGHTLYRYDELHDLKVPPGTRHGDTLRVAKMGDAGLEGGAYGELVVDVRVAGQAEARGAAWDPTEEGRESAGTDAFSGASSWGGAPPRNAPRGGGAPLDPPDGADGEAARKTSAWSPGGWTRADGDAATGPRMRFDGARDDGVRLDAAADGATRANGATGTNGGAARDPGRMRMPGHEAPTTADGAVRVDVGVVVALLGGRVTVPTPAGPVRVNVPAGTSSGTRMRLRGRGPAGPDGAATDLVAELRIVVPKRLDDESRRLIERFAELNPETEEPS